MRALVLFSLLVLGCVHDVPVAAPVAPAAAPAPAKEPAKAAEVPNRAISIVTLANKEVQCADLRRPGDLSDSALCMMPGGAFVWLSASATTLDIRVVADPPPKKTDEVKPASSASDATTKGTNTSARSAAKGAPKP